MAKSTLRELADAGVLHVGGDFHWPWDESVPVVFIEVKLEERGKCLHCEDIYDGNPATRRFGDALRWDPEQGLWVCVTPGCDGTLIDWWPERAVNGP